MPAEPAFRSITQRSLIYAYRWVARIIDFRRKPWSVFYRHLYFFYKKRTESDLLSAAKRFVRQKGWVVDIGANIGFFSLMMAKSCGARCLAFEPEPENFRLLHDAIKAARAQQFVFPFEYAVTADSGPVQLFLSDLAPTDHKIIPSRTTSGIEVLGISLDDFFARHPQYAAERIELIKIDVQGAELSVLAGMRETLARNNYPPILVEFSPQDLAVAHTSTADFLEAFRNHGYRPCHPVDESTFDPDSKNNKKSASAYCDLLMLHD